MTSLWLLIDSPTIERLGWTLLHSVWQGCLVAIVLAALLPAARRRGARAAYAAGCGALFVTVLLAGITFWLVPLSPRGSAVAGPMHSAAIAPAVGNVSSGDDRAQRIPAIVIGPLAGDSTTGTASMRSPSASARRPIPTPSSEPVAGIVPTATASSAASAPVAPPSSTSWWERAGTFGRRVRERLVPGLPWMVLAWSVGVLALSCWNVGGWFAVHRLKLNSTAPAPPAIQQAAVRIASQLGLIPGVRLVQSALVDTPVVIGALKPVILLPASLISEIPADQLESLLAHELAHVLRHDYLVNLLQTAIETLFFYHPAVWWISAKVRVERENCCDDLALGVATDRAVYIRALASVAGVRASSMAPAATSGRLIARLRRILGVVDPAAKYPSRWLTGAIILALGAAVIGAIAIGSPSAPAQDNAPKGPESKPQSATAPPTAHSLRSSGHLQVQVFDDAGKPLPGAVINTEVASDSNSREVRDYQTDSQGRATVELPKMLEGLQLFVTKPGYLKDNKSFWAKGPRRQSVIPESIEFHLLRPVTIGGVVTDEHGHPVRGARVQYGDWGAGRNETTTDAEGRWHLDNIRPDPKLHGHVSVTHLDYLQQWSWVDSITNQPSLKLTALRSQTAVIVLRAGLRVAGKVTDPAGQPVAGARVIYQAGGFSPAANVCRTDKEGRYHFQAKGPGPLKVTVFAAGWMPQFRAIVVAPQIAATDFQLKRGKTLRMRIVDRAGKPIPDAAVILGPWRDVHISYMLRELGIPMRADKEGLYEWDWAPDDSLMFDLLKSGYAETEIHVTADGREQTQTMVPILHIRGTVVDAKTGRPIDDFSAVPVDCLSSERAHVTRSELRHFKSGRFDLPFDRVNSQVPDTQYAVQIEARSYRTVRTRAYRIGDASPDLNLRLEPCQPYRGRVIDEAGKPVEGADVLYFSRSEQGSGVDLEQLDQPDPAQLRLRFKTDQNGTFEIPAPVERYLLQVVSNHGFAQAERRADEPPGDIKIERWARVTGKLMDSGKPLPNCSVVVEPIQILSGVVPHAPTNRAALTQADGSFVIEKVPPLPSTVLMQLHANIRLGLTSAPWVPLRLDPGATVDVTLGGGGIDVTGELATENQPDKLTDFSLDYFVARGPGIEPPVSLAGKGFDGRRGWTDAWVASPEGRDFLRTLRHWHVMPDPNGRFRISGVAPGEYDLAINRCVVTDGIYFQRTAARVVHLSVKEGQSHLDLGKISIPPLVVPEVGGRAPAFEFESADGRKTNLAALRGKYVLIDFWATWCGPSVATLDRVEQLRQQFAGDHPLVVLSANLDPEPAHAHAFLKSKALPWQHAFLGDWSHSDVPQRYALSDLPTYVLIDALGRILFRGGGLDAIEAKLKTLGEKPHPAGRL